MAEIVSIYELRGRQEKIAKMVAALDAHLVACSVHPFSAEAVDQVEHFSDEVWLALAAAAGVKPGSEKTREAVRDVYRKRPEHLAAVIAQMGVRR